MEIPFRELQHCNGATDSDNHIRKRKIIAEKRKISCKEFVNRNRFSLPLHHKQDVMRVWASAQHSKEKSLTLHSPCTTLVSVKLKKRRGGL